MSHSKHWDRLKSWLLSPKQHVVYSFRHSFERRLLEAGLDYGFKVSAHRICPFAA